MTIIDSICSGFGFRMSDGSDGKLSKADDGKKLKCLGVLYGCDDVSEEATSEPTEYSRTKLIKHIQECVTVSNLIEPGDQADLTARGP